MSDESISLAEAISRMANELERLDQYRNASVGERAAIVSGVLAYARDVVEIANRPIRERRRKVVT